MKKVLLYLWQLPQNIFGLLVILVTRAKNTGISWVVKNPDNTKYFGVSLGNYIIFGNYPDKTSVQHEQGHQKQSQYLGPLYLILIGIPSALWNIITRLMWVFSTKKKSWRILLMKLYYSVPWESTADKLGGVDWRKL